MQNVTTPELINLRQPEPTAPFEMEKGRSWEEKYEDKPSEFPELDELFRENTILFCPEHILLEFQDIIRNSKLSGTAYYNPYTKKWDQFPPKPEEFTAWHLQIIARNERVNTSGIMNISLYANHFTFNQIAMLRYLVRLTYISAFVLATDKGGFNCEKEKLPYAELRLAIEQTSLQRQGKKSGGDEKGDLSNSGCCNFAPANWEDLTPENKEFFEKIYAFENQAFPPDPTKWQSKVEVTWNGVQGFIDLQREADKYEEELLSFCRIAQFMMQKLTPDMVRKMAPGTPLDLTQPLKCLLRVMRGGMAAFSKGLGADEAPIEVQEARLIGYLRAIESLDKNDFRGCELEFPFSCVAESSHLYPIILKIQEAAEAKEMIWRGSAAVDYQKPTTNLIVIENTCADNHVMHGNEGPSVRNEKIICPSLDAAKAHTWYSPHLNAGCHADMKMCYVPDFKQKISAQVITPAGRNKENDSPAWQCSAALAFPTIQKIQYLLTTFNKELLSNQNRYNKPLTNYINYWLKYLEELPETKMLFKMLDSYKKEAAKLNSIEEKLAFINKLDLTLKFIDQLKKKFNNEMDVINYCRNIRFVDYYKDIKEVSSP